MSQYDTVQGHVTSRVMINTGGKQSRRMYCICSNVMAEVGRGLSNVFDTRRDGAVNCCEAT